MRKLKSLLFLVLLVSVTTARAQNWVTITADNPSPASVTLMSSDDHSSVVQFRIGGFNLVPVATPRGEAFIPQVSGATSLLEEGNPDLPKLTASVIIPDRALMELHVVSSRYIDYPFIEIAPSKGNFTRDIDPASVPYRYGKVYETDQFFPADQAFLRDPYILRDHRGQTVVVSPFAYNPVTKVLRVYYEMTVEIRQTGTSSVNALNRGNMPERISSEFSRIYDRHFLNAPSKTSRYTPLEEQGNMLIICYKTFLGEMEDFVEWKRTIGIPVEMVDVTEIGANSTAIKNYVADYYATNGLTYLLLVGDHAQVPTITSGNIGGPSDHAYGYLAGNDHYPDVFVGRFSAENAQQVQTQVVRTIAYEKNPDTSVDWFAAGVGIASGEGTGDDGEYDWQHMRNVRTDLVGYTYTTVAELYDGTRGGEDLPGNPNSTHVSTEVNTGRSIINYTGHGSQTSWSTTGFSNTGVNGLVNNNMWPFIWSVACVNGDFLNGTCFAEAWLRAGNANGPTGAVAALMSTINQTWNPPMEGQDEMVDILVESYENNIKRTFGGISMNGCMKMNDTYGSGGADMTDTWLIFGDPSVVVRTAMPQMLSVTHEPVAFIGSNQFTVNCPTEGAFATLTMNGEILGSAAVNNGVAVISIPTLTDVGEMTLAVTAYNHIPYLTQIEVLPLEGPYLVYGNHAINDAAANNNQQLDFGESVIMALGIRNAGTEDVADVQVTIRSADPFITLTDTTGLYPLIPAGQTLAIPDEFAFSVSTDVPDGYKIAFEFEAVSSDNEWSGNFLVTAHSVTLNFGGSQISDTGGNNNGKADPGETFQLYLSILNAGTAPAPDVYGLLTSDDPHLMIHTDSIYYGTVEGYQTLQGVFSLTALPDTPSGHTASLTFTMSSGGNFTSSSIVSVIIGQIPVLIIDLDGNRNSGPKIKTSLNNLSITADYLTSWPLVLGPYQSVFVCLGTYPNNSVLTNTQGQILANFLNNNGKIYLEGGDTWVYNDPTPVHPMFKIDGDKDGSGDLSTLLGQDTTFTEGMAFSFQGDNSYIDRILPLENSIPLFRNQSPEYFAAIAYDGGNYKTIGSSFEFGGLGDSDGISVKDSLMKAYITYFGISGAAPMLANFIASEVRICDQDEVIFTDLSAGNIVSWSWSFPGGVPDTANEQNPAILYRTPGVYDVILTVSDGINTQTVIKQEYITVDFCSGTQHPDERIVTGIYPNPAGDMLNIDIQGLNGETTILLTTPSGAVVRSERIAAPAIHRLNLSGIPNGVYIVAIQNRSANRYHKLIVTH